MGDFFAAGFFAGDVFAAGFFAGDVFAADLIAVGIVATAPSLASAAHTSCS